MNVSSETFCEPVAAMRTSRRRSCRFCGGLARDALVADDHQRVAGCRHVGKAHNLDRNRGPGLLHLLSLVVDERAHFTERSTDDDDVARRAAFRSARARSRPRRVRGRGRDSMTTPRCAAILVGFEIVDVGFEQDRFEQFVDARRRFSPTPEPSRRCRPNRRVADPSSASCCLDAIGLRVRLVHLVDRNDDRHARGARRG